MDVLTTEYDKRKLQLLLKDLLKIGCIKGFRFFSMYLRGREELLLKVQNEQVTSHPITQRFVEDDVSSQHGRENQNEFGKEPNNSHDDKPLPRPYDSMMLSKNTQRNLSGFHFLDIGLPPASPCETDAANAEYSSTLFLIAAYARYKNPYVWVRSNHHRLISFTECHTSQDEVYQIQDSPLKLKSTTNWRHKEIKLWHIIAEVVRINVIPSPRNPFEVDHTYFDELSPEDYILATGAMIFLLQRILLHGDHSYQTKVSQDLNELMLKHMKMVQMLAPEMPRFERFHQQQQTPIHQQNPTQQQTQQQVKLNQQQVQQKRVFVPPLQYSYEAAAQMN
ncbi:uncharacterized protein [Clytia hemisphaerica]|uniref:DUF7886 domain-containing protein n=1 Tax=Clytia hemisphaerica TaxID=252671 RepID=A0A7M6DQD6_9CNID|eukprot:TCONS_00053808-protein